LLPAVWDNTSARDTFHKHIRDVVADLPADPLGTVGVIDETSSRKWGDHTPGVQRQYLGCVGKIDNGIVTVHIGVAKGRFQTLLDADLSFPSRGLTTAHDVGPQVFQTMSSIARSGDWRWTNGCG